MGEIVSPFTDLVFGTPDVPDVNIPAISPAGSDPTLASEDDAARLATGATALEDLEALDEANNGLTPTVNAMLGI